MKHETELYIQAHKMHMNKEYNQSLQLYVQFLEEHKMCDKLNYNSMMSLMEIMSDNHLTPDTFEWLRDNARQDKPVSQYILSQVYGEGLGIEKDLKIAFELCHRSAVEHNNAMAQSRLGYLYHNGLGVEKNEELSLEMLHKGASQGYFKAQHDLGDIYLNIDKNKALSYYIMSAGYGFPIAQKKLDTHRSSYSYC